MQLQCQSKNRSDKVGRVPALSPAVVRNCGEEEDGGEDERDIVSAIELLAEFACTLTIVVRHSDDITEFLSLPNFSYMYPIKLQLERLTFAGMPVVDPPRDPTCPPSCPFPSPETYILIHCLFLAHLWPTFAALVNKKSFKK